MYKNLIMEITSEMPETATVPEIFDAIIVRLSALKGFDDISKGNYTTQEDLLKEIKKW